MESVLGFIRAALCLGHRVVVGAALAAQRAANAEGLDDTVDALVLKLAAPVRVENGYPVERLPAYALECLLHRSGVLAPAAERPLDLPCTVAVPYRCSSSLAGVPDLYCATICSLNS